MKEQYIVNHVMSRDIDSGIFTAILEYFKKYAPKDYKIVETVRPMENADVYHYHRPHLETNLLPGSVCTVHHDLNDLDVWHARSNFIPRYKEARAIVCLNSIQKNILINEEDINENKVSVIPHGYCESLNISTKIRRDKFIIGIASRRYGRRVKGEAYLFELVKRLDPNNIKFILVGMDRELDALAFREWGFEVDVYERLPYRVFNGFYNSIDCLLMCSTHEGGPANIPEALATGTPIVATPIGMVVDYVQDGVNGMILSLNPDQDAEMINEISNNEEIFANLVLNSKKFREKVLTWQSVVGAHFELYESIINKKKIK